MTHRSVTPNIHPEIVNKRRHSRPLDPIPIWKRPLFSEHVVLFVSIVYFLIFLLFTPGLASPSNIRNIFTNMLPLLVVAVGQTFVLITAGIDLSATSIIALTSVIGASAMNTENGFLALSPWAVPAGILVMLLLGVLLGALNGLTIALIRMPPFIVTLTSMMFFRGFAVWYTQSRNIFHLPGGFNVIGRDSVGFIPNAVIPVGLIVVAASVCLRKTLLGRWVYAVGHNPKAALISGVPVRRTILFVYMISGFCAAVSSVLYTARLETGSPTMGDKILLDIIAATVIGGASLFGGKGKILWTVNGVLFITLIGNTLDMFGLSFFVVMMVKGTVILFAAFLDAMRHRILAEG